MREQIMGRSCGRESSQWVRASLKQANIVSSRRLVVKQDRRMRVLEQWRRIQGIGKG